MGVTIDLKKYKRRKGETEEMHRQRVWAMEGRDPQTGAYLEHPQADDGAIGSARHTQHLRDGKKWIEQDAQRTADTEWRKTMAPVRAAEVELAREADYQRRYVLAFGLTDKWLVIESCDGRSFANVDKAFAAYATAVKDEFTFTQEGMQILLEYMKANGCTVEQLCRPNAISTICDRLRYIGIFEQGVHINDVVKTTPVEEHVPSIDEQVAALDSNDPADRRRIKDLLGDAAAAEMTPIVKDWTAYLAKFWDFYPTPAQLKAAMAIFGTMNLAPWDRKSYDFIRQHLCKKLYWKPLETTDEVAGRIADEWAATNSAGKPSLVAYDRKVRSLIEAAKMAGQFIPSFAEYRP